MTEAEWRELTHPAPMLDFIRDSAADRQLRLLACAWCREVWYQLANNLCREAVDLSERVADDASILADMERVRDAAWATSTDSRGYSYSGRKGAGFNAALYSAIGKMWHINIVLESTQLLAARSSYQTFQCRIIRDVFGNPFRPVSVNPSWLTSTVVALARGIYADRAVDRLPILADALMDAGCDNADILDHCRSDGPHARGCWVVDLLLGKS